MLGKSASGNMRPPFQTTGTLFYLALLLSTIIPPASLHAQNSAKVGAVNPEATGTPPGGSSHTLSIGSTIVVKERVHTSASGSAQIIFSDESTLNVGHNSDMVIDEYYFDKNTKSGNMVASATKGALRYIGGQISHDEGATIKTPAATLGIRGGIVTIMLPLPPAIAASDPNLAGLKGELIIAQFGTVTLTNNTGQTVLPNGFATVINTVNSTFSTPFRLSEATLQLIITILHSGPGQTGGTSNPPTNQVTNLPPGVNVTFLPNPSPPPGNDPLGYSSIFSTGNSLSQNKSQTNQVQSVASRYMPTTHMPPPPPPPHYHHHHHFHHHYFCWGGWGECGE